MCGIDTVIIGDSIYADPACYSITWNKFFLKNSITKFRDRLGSIKTYFVALTTQISIKIALVNYGGNGTCKVSPIEMSKTMLC